MMVRHNNGHAKSSLARRTCSRAAMPLSQVTMVVNAVFLRLADDGLVDARSHPGCAPESDSPHDRRTGLSPGIAHKSWSFTHPDIMSHPQFGRAPA